MAHDEKKETNMDNTMNHKPLIYICSPYAGETERNRFLAMLYCQVAVTNGMVALAPHLLYPQFIYDDSEEEGNLSMECGLELLDLCDEIRTMIGEGIGKGMEKEIDYTRKTCIPIRFFTLAVQEVRPK